MQTTSAVRKTAPSSPATHVVPPAPHSYFALAISLLAVALGAIAYHSIPDPKRETKIIYWTITLIVFSFAIGFFSTKLWIVFRPPYQSTLVTVDGMNLTGHMMHPGQAGVLLYEYGEDEGVRFVPWNRVKEVQLKHVSRSKEANEMLNKIVAAIKADKAVALAMINNGEGAFTYHDLYPFCFRLSDGKNVAGPIAVAGMDVRTLKDSTGKVFGLEEYKAAPNDQVTEVSYMLPKPSTIIPVFRVDSVTRADDLGCGVGYYK